MKIFASIDEWTVCIYRFSASSSTKNKRVDDFLAVLATYCQYQIVESLDNNPKLYLPNTMALLLITSLSDFDKLRDIQIPEYLPKIISYFFTPEEFGVVDKVDFRRPFKARSFKFVCPDKTSLGDLIYASPIKVFDSIFVQTRKSRMHGVVLGSDIENYNDLSLQSAIAQIIEMGWYLRDMGLNHSDSFAGTIAHRFGKGLLITAKNTDKYQIKSDRICYIDSVNPGDNETRYVGQYRPSSETIEAHLVFQTFPAINIMIHFHHKPMTYSPKLNFYRTNKYRSCGTLDNATAIVNKLRESCNFVIANGHGEFCFAENFSKAKNVIDEIKNLL